MSKCTEPPQPRSCRSFKVQRRSYSPNYQQTRAEKLVSLIEVNVKETITSIDNLKVDTDREIIALLTETNSFANDLESLVYALLRLVIRSYKNGQAASELAKSAKVFSDYVHTIQKSVHHDVSVLKQVLKLSVAGATPEAQNLLKLLNNESNNAMRQSIVTIIDDIFFVVQKALYRNQIEQSTTQELQDIALNKVKKGVCSQVDNVKKADEISMDELIACTQHAIRHEELIVRTIDEESDGYEGDAKLQLSKIAYNMSEDLAKLDNVLRTKTDPEVIKQYVTACCGSFNQEMAELALLGDKNSPDKKVSVNLNNLVLLAFAHNMAVANQFQESVTDIQAAK